MDETLYKAARDGNTSKLQELLEEDPMLLDRVLPLFSETPLHIAALAGRAEFAKLLLGQAPWLAKQPSNRNGLSSLHIAAAKDHVGVAYVLLDLDPDLGLIGDNEGCGPLHYAAYYGSIEVGRLLVMKNALVLKEVNTRGETALHVAFKCQQYKMVELLMGLLRDLGNEFCDEVTRRTCDKNGLTFWQLALGSAQSQVAELVKNYSSRGCDNPKIITEDRDEQDEDSTNKLKHGNETMSNDRNDTGTNSSDLKEEEWSKKARESFLIVGSLIATVTFQALVTPPQSIWKDNNLKLYDINKHKLDVSWLSMLYLVSNSAAFVASCWGLLIGWRDGSRLLVWLGCSLIWTIMCYFIVLVSMVGKSAIFVILVMLSLLSLPVSSFIRPIPTSEKSPSVEGNQGSVEGNQGGEAISADSCSTTIEV